MQLFAWQKPFPIGQLSPSMHKFRYININIIYYILLIVEIEFNIKAINIALIFIFI